MKKTSRYIREWIEIIAIAFVIAIIMENYLISFAIVQGRSMEPTIRHQDRLLVLRNKFFIDNIREGDIVVFRPPGDDNELFVKRVVAIGKDHYSMAGLEVYVNNEKRIENYVLEDSYLTRAYNFLEGVVPQNSFFVLGDNRNDSNDSRSFGYITKDQIIGKVILRIWPIREAKLFFE